MKNKYHFIAIGGVGMSGLAKYLLQNGYEVSGSDINDSKYVKGVRDLGAKVYIGHSEDNVPDDCIVVASTAIREYNPEILKAKRLGLPIWHRSDLLAEISRGEEYFIGYSGTHGKTTTSGLCSYVLEKAGLKPSYVVGGIIPDIHTNANCGHEKYFIAELDESDGTIVKYSPNLVVVNNLEPDHLDFYKNGLESILEIDFNIEVESASDAGLLILSNIGNTRKDMEYLVKCLQKIDQTNYSDICYLENKKYMPMLTPIIKMTLREAFYSHKEVIPKTEAIGRIAAEVIAECPPGISVLLPGELITEEHIPYLVDYDFIEVIK